MTERFAPSRTNPVLRGWVNCFRVGNSGRVFDKVEHLIECGFEYDVDFQSVAIQKMMFSADDRLIRHGST